MNIKKTICLSLICLLTIGFIFLNSSQSSVESNARSYRIAQKILVISEKHDGLNSVINTVAINLARIEKMDVTGFIEPVGILNLLIRKCAHAFEFFLLALILFLTFDTLNMKMKDIIIYSWFILLLSAVFDEFSQSFILGRTSSVVDVLIDFFGGILAAICFSLVKLIYRIFKNKKYNSLFSIR